MITAAETTDDTDPSLQYEELRACILLGPTAGDHAGLVLLLRQGVAGWMARRKAGVASVRRMAVPNQRTGTPLFSNEIHAGLVQIIAGMAMAGKQEVHP